MDKKGIPQMTEIENITILFHETYEDLAKKYGYETRNDTKVFDMESPNGKTMLKTVEKIITPYLKEIERLNNIINELEKYCEISISMNFNMNNSELQNQIVEDYTKMLDKLKELKDSDK